jgi:hypothetical protein
MIFYPYWWFFRRDEEDREREKAERQRTERRKRKEKIISDYFFYLVSLMEKWAQGRGSSEETLLWAVNNFKTRFFESGYEEKLLLVSEAQKALKELKISFDPPLGWRELAHEIEDPSDDLFY